LQQREGLSRRVDGEGAASVLVASGENARSWLGRNPMTRDVPVPAATRPPLSATPGGVTSDHWPAPVGRTKSCQKLSSDAADPPMTVIAQVPCEVTSEVLSGTVTAGGLGAAPEWPAPDPAAVCDLDPQPAARPAQARARPILAHPLITSGPAPGGRTG